MRFGPLSHDWRMQVIESLCSSRCSGRSHRGE